MNHIFRIIFISIVFLPQLLFSQDQDYFSQDYMRHQDYVYRENIRSVELYREGWKMSPPTVSLKSGQQLILSFDDMDGDVKYYNYTIIHCDAMWQPSELTKVEYIRGFDEDEIKDYAFSFNTLKVYTNYRLSFPTDYMKYTKSGNYILKVWMNEDMDSNLVLTRRFIVVDQKVTIIGKVVPPVKVEDRNYRQQVEFMINPGSYFIQNPYSDLKVMVLQNWRWDNAVYNVQPRMVVGNKLDYRFIDDLVFDGGNEFRNFDIKSMKYQSERIALIDHDYYGTHFYLHTDERKTFKQYVRDDDLNGKYYLEKEDAKDSDIESDYAYVHFTLPYTHPLVTGNMYVFGALTDWNFTDEAMMTYDYENNIYEASLYLKQGYYNYAYVFLEDGTEAGDITLIEGNHWDTNNEYIILVYFREPGTYYDQMVGIEYVSAHIK
ncbi:MAG: DUF5103 domain-containing protein [Bacteroidetes bacterium]|nr:MAG: DUF5103 domain-containing protein [Bacteroidota bacterium]RLD80984.1 MAG: DUF5103 domain-containing protein [Bacteroidota bacterium]